MNNSEEMPIAALLDKFMAGMNADQKLHFASGLYVGLTRQVNKLGPAFADIMEAAEAADVVVNRLIDEKDTVEEAAVEEGSAP